ncbi:MAG: response regulator transcription factor [Nitrospirota bacterium]
MNGRSKIYVPGDAGNPALLEDTERQHALTSREREILSLIALGKANKEIAEQLAISVRTVETHRAKIMRKLGLRSHAALIYYAMRWNITNVP